MLVSEGSHRVTKGQHPVMLDAGLATIHVQL